MASKMTTVRKTPGSDLHSPFPLRKGHSLKLNWSEGVTERIGTNFTTFGATWQYTWFD